jgi:hypothetical protein
MPDTDTSPPIQVGDKIRTKYPPILVGWVMEKMVSPTEPGKIIYTVQVPMSAETLTIILREYDIEKA